MFLCECQARHLPQFVSEEINSYVLPFLACSVLLFLLMLRTELSSSSNFNAQKAPHARMFEAHPIGAIADVRVGIMTFFLPYFFQMFEAEEDGAITQLELAVMLKTALGVTHLSVSRLFNAIDVVDTGKITFGE